MSMRRASLIGATIGARLSMPRKVQSGAVALERSRRASTQAVGSPTHNVSITHAESTTSTTRSETSAAEAPDALDPVQSLGGEVGGEDLAADGMDREQLDRMDDEAEELEMTAYYQATERLMVKWEDEAKQHGWSTWGW